MAAVFVVITGVVIAINTLAATVTNIDQTSGPTTGGQPISITGTGFQPAAYTDGTATYTPLQYLNFTGTQHIDTGFDQLDHTVATIDFELENTFTATDGIAVFGSRAGLNNYMFALGKDSGGVTTWRSDYASTISQIPGSNALDFQRHTVIKTGIQTYYDGTLKSTASGTMLSSTNAYSIYLGKLNNAGTAASIFRGKIYSFQLIKHGSQVQNLVPVCKTATNQAGMWDKVTSTFFPSSSGTDFDCTGIPTDYESLTTVTFDGVKCTNLQVVSDSEITCDTPAHSAGVVSVVVQVADGTTTTVVQQYTYTPGITSVTPNPISTNGGQITIHGQGFVAYPNPPTPTTLQEMTQEYCTSMPIYNGTNTSAILTLNDPRGDGQNYQIAKLADNNCWMLNNLKLGSLSGTTLLTANDTNLANGYTFTLPKVNGGSSDSYNTPIVDAKVDVAGAGSLQTDITASDFYGYYYNWCAAKAGTPESCKDNVTIPEPSTYDICPANWRLPTGGDTGEIAYLNGMMAGDGTFSTAGDSAHATKWIFTGPFKGVYSNSKGGINNFPFAGTSGNYWTGSFLGANASMAQEYNFRSGDIIAGTQLRMRTYREAVHCMTTGGMPTPYTPAITVGGTAIDPSDIISVTDTEIVVNAPAGSAIASLTAPYYEGTVDVDVEVNGINAVPEPTASANDLTYRAPMQVTSVNPTSGPASGGTNVTLTGYNFQPYAYSDGTNNYYPMEHLEFNGTQAIDTGVIPTNSTKTTVIYDTPRYAGQVEWLFGVGNSSTSTNIYGVSIGMNNQTRYRIWRGNNANSLDTAVGTSLIGKHTIKYSISDGTEVDGTQIVGVLSTTAISSNQPMVLGGYRNLADGTLNPDTSKFVGKIYGTQIANSVGVMVRDFVPVCSSAGVGGMWDKVSGTFFGNNGTGSFACAPSTVTFDNGGTPATCTNPVVVNNTTITCTTTAHSVGNVKVTVNNGTETATSTNPIYNYHPTITAVNPDHGPTGGGNTVTVTGSGFSGYTTTDMNLADLPIGTNLRGVTLEFDTSYNPGSGVLDYGTGQNYIAFANGYHLVQFNTGEVRYYLLDENCTLGPGMESTIYEMVCDDFYNNSVQFYDTGAEPDWMMSSYTFPSDADFIISDTQIYFASGVNPFETTMVRGVSVPVQTSVQIGGQDCANVAVLSDSQLTCTVPASNLGGAYGEGVVDVSVTVNGQVAELPQSYTYRAAMEIAAISPSAGPVGGGTEVEITGHNFVPFGADLYHDTAGNSYFSQESLTFSGTQYINTGITPDGISEIDLDFQLNSTTGIMDLFGSSAGCSNPSCNMFIFEANSNAGASGAGNYWRILYGGSGVTYTTANFTFAGPTNTARHHFVFDAKKVYFDEEPKKDYTAVTGSQATMPDLYLGAQNSQGTGQSFINAKIYSFQIEKNGGLVRDLVPVCNAATGNAGMFDKVSGTFFGNSGTGSFACTPMPTTATLDIAGTPAVCNNPVVVNNTTITCTTSAHTLGKVAVTVNNGVETADFDDFQYLASPTVSVTTGTGSVIWLNNGGGSFTLSGTASDPNGGQKLVVSATLGGVLKTYTVADSGVAGSANGWSLTWTAAELGDGFTFDGSVSALAVRVENQTAYAGANYAGVLATDGDYREVLYGTADWAGKLDVDTTPPTVTILPLPASGGAWVNIQPTPTVSAVDNTGGSGIAVVRYAFADDLNETCSAGGFEIPSTSAGGSLQVAVPLGTTTVYACAVDIAGNVASTSETYRWENIAPSEAGVSWSPVEAPWNNGSSPVTFTLSGVTDTGGSGLASGNNYSCMILPVNGATCTVTAYDNAGNYTIYTSPPNRVSTVGVQIYLTNPGDANWVNSASYWTNVTPTPQIDVTDTMAGIVRIAYSYADDLDAGCTNGTAVANGAVLSGVATGGAVLYACAVDAAGNVTQTFATYNYEVIPPVCTGWSPAVAPWNQGTGVTFMPTGCSDTGGSGLVNPLSCTTAGANGATCDVTVYDNAGNSVVLTSPVDNVDSVGPVLSFPDATGPAFVESDVPLVAKILLTPNLAPIAVWRYSLTPFPIDAGSGLSVCTGGVEIDLTAYDFAQPFIVPDSVPAGGFTVYSCAIDEAGNIVFGDGEYNWRKPVPPTPPGESGPDVPGIPNTGLSLVVKIGIFIVILAASAGAVVTTMRLLKRGSV
ncbi:hypothetical protein FACS189431_4200 [Alphaproteobacteria bacterium]|nr:hypothetical protein FACS189431_4200 [Alphaproteobacteria bacterium]